MNNHKKYSFILIVAPLILLIILNAHLFGKRQPEKKTVPKETVEQKYGRTLINPIKQDLDWNISLETSESSKPEISGKSGILVDNTTGNTLFNLEVTTRFKIASLVKIMTAVVALEHINVTDEITVSLKAASVGENSMGLTSGETYTLEELLYGLVLNSGNDAATAIAEGVAGDTPTFVAWMNIKARELGLSDTYYADPDGLGDSSYSTAQDLAKLTHYALGNQEFKKVVSTIQYEIPYSTQHKYLSLFNQTNLLTTYPGVLGVKTGYTEEAGLCLVTYAENEGKGIIGVVLKSVDRRMDMIKLLDYGYSSFGIKIDHPLLKF